MFVKKVKNPDGRIKLAIIHNYWIDSKNKASLSMKKKTYWSTLFNLFYITCNTKTTWIPTKE